MLLTNTQKESKIHNTELDKPLNSRFRAIPKTIAEHIKVTEMETASKVRN